MSRAIRATDDRTMSHIVQTDKNEFYYVDTTFIKAANYPSYYETMIFKYNPKKRSVENWDSLYTKAYDTEKEAAKEHQNIITHLEKYL